MGIVVPQESHILRMSKLVRCRVEFAIQQKMVFADGVNPVEQRFPLTHECIVRQLDVVFPFDDQPRLNQSIDHRPHSIIFFRVGVQ